MVGILYPSALLCLFFDILFFIRFRKIYVTTLFSKPSKDEYFLYFGSWTFLAVPALAMLIFALS